MIGYCMSCKKMKIMLDRILKKMINSVWVYEGKCETCGKLIIKKK